MKRLKYLGLISLICVALGSSPAFATGDCSDYTDLSGLELPITATGTTSGATADYQPSDGPACWNGYWRSSCAMGPDVTYKWAAPRDGVYTVHIVESDFDADLLVYHFTCPVEPVYPDDFICGSHEAIGNRGLVSYIELLAGQEILIVVDGYWTQAGQFEFMIYDSSELEISIADAMSTYGIPGLQAAIVKGGEIRWQASFGMANIDNEIAVTDETLFLCASVSKTITGTAVMQLYEDGLLGPDGLDADVNALLPGPIEVVHPGYPGVPITVRMLLSHAAGISHRFMFDHSYFVCDQNSPITLAEFVEGYFTPGGDYYHPIANFMPYAPGEGYSYSGPGSALAGYLVEILTEMSFTEYCQERIFGPLGIEPASFMLEDLLAEPGPDLLAMGYSWEGAELWTPYCHMHAPWLPAAFMRTNASQLSRFLMAIMQGGELDGVRILQESSVELMHTRHYSDLGSDYGLLWWHWDIDGRPVWGHWGGWTWFCRTAMFFNAEEEIGVVLLTNSGSVSDFYLEAFVDLLFDRAAAIDYQTVDVADPNGITPAVALLDSCHPNPFNPMTTISYRLPRATAVNLVIYDLKGRVVRRVKTGVLDQAGAHEATWDGKDESGGAVPSGTYVVRLATRQGVESRKVMLVR